MAIFDKNDKQVKEVSGKYTRNFAIVWRNLQNSWNNSENFNNLLHVYDMENVVKDYSHAVTDNTKIG